MLYVLLQSGRCLSRFLLRFKHVTCVQQYYCLPPDVSVRKLIISIQIFRITQHCSYLDVTSYKGADKSLARPDWKKRLKGRHFSSDAEVIAAAETWLDGQTSEFIFEWLAKVRVWSLWLVSFLCRAKGFSAPRCKKWNNILKSVKFSRVGLKTQWDECGGRLLDDNASVDAVIMWPKRFLRRGSTKFQLALDLARPWWVGLCLHDTQRP